MKAEDRELNQWASLKKTYQYRPDTEETYEAQAYKKKGENDALKKRVLLSVYQPIIGYAEPRYEFARLLLIFSRNNLKYFVPILTL